MEKTIMAALIAAIDVAKDKPYMYTDEDFTKDHKGNWVKFDDGRWDSVFGREVMLKVFIGVKYKLITTYEQRLVRYAAKRTKEIMLHPQNEDFK